MYTVMMRGPIPERVFSVIYCTRIIHVMGRGSELDAEITVKDAKELVESASQDNFVQVPVKVSYTSAALAALAFRAYGMSAEMVTL